MSALKTRKDAVISLTPAADYSANTGKWVTHDGATATLGASGTAPGHGIIVEAGKDATSKVTVALFGGGGTALMKCGGVIAAGDRVQQKNDGTILTDAGAGNARVVIGQALEAGVANDLIEVAIYTPSILA